MRHLVALGLGLFVMVAACGGSDAPAPQALPRVAASSPQPRPPTQPPTPSPREQVVSVVRHYYAAANRLPDDMDPHSLASLFTAACPCRAQVQAVRRAAARGEHYIDHAHLNALRPTIESSRRAVVFVDLAAASGGLRRADGTVVTSAPPARHVRRVFHLVKISDRWLIDQIDAVG